MVLDHLIRLKYIRTNLAAPGDITLFPVLPFQFRSLSVLLNLVKLCLQHIQRHLPVSALASFGLAGNNDPRWKMRNAHCGLNLVDVLATFAPASKCINGEIFLVYLDTNIFLKLRNSVAAGERSVPPPVRVEG